VFFTRAGFGRRWVSESGTLVGTDLVFVAIGVDFNRPVAIGLAVAGGIDVGTTGQQDSVTPIERLRQDIAIGLEDQRLATGPLDRLEVVGFRKRHGDHRALRDGTHEGTSDRLKAQGFGLDADLTCAPALHTP
jgi:hypothetical protein